MHAPASETLDRPLVAETPPTPSRRHQVVIVGGGQGGISVAARLINSLPEPDVAIIEPSETHYYQPLWTLVGGGVVDKQKTARPQQSVIPKGAHWIKDSVVKLDPENNRVVTASGEEIGYDQLVVAPGIELNWEAVAGLPGRVGADQICSNYSFEHVDYTWETIDKFRGGTALFIMPPQPIKCAGAPQKIMYMADDTFRKHGVREKSKIIYASATPGIFGVPEYAATLNKVIERKGIETRYQHLLKEIRPEARQAVFIDQADDDAEVVIDYDMIHVVPPQRAPGFVRESPLADDAGFAAVDKQTLQSADYPNVWALGDASSLPTSRTGAAVRKQTPVLTENLLADLRRQQKARKQYDGYTACPLVTGYGKLVMAEFAYDGKLAQTFPVDQTKERWSMYQVKKSVLPALYWHRILKGKA